jgi:hypothetical protein
MIIEQVWKYFPLLVFTITIATIKVKAAYFINSSLIINHILFKLNYFLIMMGFT